MTVYKTHQKNKDSVKNISDIFLLTEVQSNRLNLFFLQDFSFLLNKITFAFYQPGYRSRFYRDRKVRTAKGNTPVNSRLSVKREETVPQKITVPIYRDKGENVR